MPRKLLVLCRVFPKLSETFVLGECLALQAQGFDVHVVSLRSAAETVIHDTVARLQHAPFTLDRLSQCLTLLPWLMMSLISHCYAGFQSASNRVTPTAAKPSAATSLPTFLQAMWVSAYCRRHHIQHIHAHYIAETAEIAARAARSLSIHFSISAHAKDIYLGHPARMAQLMRAASFTATCTSFNEAHLRRIEPGARIKRVYHGIDQQDFQPSPELRSQPPLILSVGRFREKKGFDVLIDACSLLLSQGHLFQCEIVGYGEQEGALRARIKALGIEHRVRILGAEARTTLIQRFKTASLFVLPCRIAADGDRDGIPNVILEAMSMAMPVISTPVSGIPEVIEPGVNGCLVPPDDASALTHAIVTLLEDADARERLGTAARKTIAEQFSWQKSAQQLNELLLTSSESMPSLARTAASEG